MTTIVKCPSCGKEDMEKEEVLAAFREAANADHKNED